MKFKKFIFTLLLTSLFFLNMIHVAASSENEGFCPGLPENSKSSCGEEANNNNNNNNAINNREIKEKNASPKKDSDELIVEEIPKDMQNRPSPSNESSNYKSTDSQENKSFKSKKKIKETPQEEEIEYPDELEYQELFQRPGEQRKYVTSFTLDSNYTEFYNFNIDDEEIDSIKRDRITIYPPKRWQLNYQGNFLHFYKVAYEKGMPVYFTVDSMLYAVNENLNQLNTIFYEEILIYYLRFFYTRVINFANELMDSAEGEPHRYMISHAQLYFAVALELISDGFEKIKYPPILESQVRNFVEKIKKYEVSEFYMFYAKKTINCSLLLPVGQFTRNKKMQNLYQSLNWFIHTKFLLDKKEIHPVWYIGKLIHGSNSVKLYRQIFKSIKFVMGQDSLTPSIVDIYQIGIDLGYKEVFDLSEEQADNLLKKIYETKITIDLPFLNDNFFFSKQILEAFKREREHTTNLFNYHFDVEDWVKNKLLIYNSNSFRIMLDSYELTSAIHHASAFKQLIFNRYKGKKSMEGEELVPLRDGIDLTEYFEKAKYSIKDSMNDHPENWRKNILNHMHYILYKSSRRIKLSDPVYRTPYYKQKNFFTAYSGLVHFKREFAIMKSIPKVKKVKGGLVDVVMEPNIGFYEEILELYTNYKNLLNELKTFAAQELLLNAPTNSNLRFSFVNARSLYQHAIDVTEMLLDAIKKQESGKMDEETKNNLKELVSFNDQYNSWIGWYVKFLNQNSHEDIFSFYSWGSKIHASPPIEDKQFNGAVFYNYMNFPLIGLIVKEDKFTKKRKLLLHSSYYAKESIKRFAPKVNFSEEVEALENRE